MATSIYEMSVEQRQREYEKEGLPSWKIAEWEAEVRRVSQQEKVVDQAVRHGMPNLVGSEGDRMQFSDPTGVKRTFSPGGDQTSLTIPSHIVEPDLSPYQREQLQSLHRVRHGVATGTLDINNYKDQYSPRDQKNIEKLYQTRSEVSTNPELTPEERQQFMDKIDSAISRVPRLSPIMQEPTPQQKFEASIVTDQATGQRGIFDLKTGKFNPLVDPKAVQTKEKERIEMVSKEYNSIMAAAEKNKESLDPDVAYRRAKNTVALFYGEVPEITDQIDPQLIPIWRDEVDRSSWFKASNTNMLKARTNFIIEAERRGISSVQAGHTFMMLWQEAARNPDDEFHKWVPAFGEKEQRQLSQVVTGRMQEGDPYAAQQQQPRAEKLGRADLRVGEGKVTVDGKTVSTMDAKPVPPGMETIWPNLDEETKTDVQRLLMSGKTVPEVLAKMKELGLI